MAASKPPKPPTRTLTPYGLGVFNEYYLKLDKEQGEVDLRQLEDFAYYSQKIREAQDKLDGEELIIMGKMGEKPNPLTDIIKGYEMNRRKIANELGIGMQTKKRIKRLEKSTDDHDQSTPTVDKYK